MATGPLRDTDRKAFRGELSRLQTDLGNYARFFADLAAVEALTDLGDL
jgi:hypothetical protein